MGPMDYLAVAAVLISLASLHLSIRNTHFSRMAKESELRAAVLGKAAEVSSRLARIAALKAEIHQHAKMLNDTGRLELYNNAKPDQLPEDADRLFRNLADFPTSSAMTVYETFYHQFRNLNERLMLLEELMEKVRTTYLANHEPPPHAP